MASWRERREERSQARLEKALTSVLAGTPLAQNMAPGAMPTQVRPAPQLAGPHIYDLAPVAHLLARDPDTFAGGLGPAFPLGFMPLDPVNDNGRPNPRRYQYPIAWNLDLEEHLAQWNILAAAAVQVDLFARAIAIRSGDVTKMDWSWQVTKDAINLIVDENQVSTSEAALIARSQFLPEITRLTEAFENPYPQSDRSWEEWITEALWQILVYDGLAIHPAMNLGGEVIGFDIIDASTIKVLLDDEGGTPRPPDPAYQQILYGFPRGEFLASPNKGAPTFYGGEFGIDERDQLSYFVLNRRTRSPYGISPTEMALAIGNVYVERLKWMTAAYTSGSTAQVYFKTSDVTEINEKNFADWNRIMNGWLSGNTAQRQLSTALPGGFDPVFAPQIGEQFKADYDEMWMKRVAAMYGVQPSQFGVIARAGLGGGKGAAEGEQDLTETVSSKPQNKHLERIVTSLARRYLNAPRGLAFTLIDDEGSEAELEKAKALQQYWSFGAMTSNEVREELGLPRYTFPEADAPMVLTTMGASPLEGALSGASTQAQPEAQEDPEGGESPEAPDGQGPEAPAGLKAKEAEAFKKFAKSGKTREFVFEHHTSEEAELLKAGLAPRPKVSLKRKKEDLHSFPHVERVASAHVSRLAAALGAMTGLGTAIQHALNGQAASAAVKGSIAFDTQALTVVLTDVYRAAGEAGGTTSGARIQALLAQAGIRIKGIEGTALDHVTTAVADGVNSGASAAQIATDVQASIEGMTGRQASMVATTEASRAYNAAYIDQATQAGVTQLNWVAYDDACPECLDLEAGSPYDVGSFPDCPDHPACRCVPDSVIESAA